MLQSWTHVPQRILMALVRGYRFFLSPWLGSSCRFEPTCSRYTLEALERHGAVAGVYLGVCRIGRCHPWCSGGLDPVPGAVPRFFASSAESEAERPSPFTNPPTP